MLAQSVAREQVPVQQKQQQEKRRIVSGGVPMARTAQVSTKEARGMDKEVQQVLAPDSPISELLRWVSSGSFCVEEFCTDRFVRFAAPLANLSWSHPTTAPHPSLPLFHLTNLGNSSNVDSSPKPPNPLPLPSLLLELVVRRTLHLRLVLRLVNIGDRYWVEVLWRRCRLVGLKMDWEGLERRRRRVDRASWRVRLLQGWNRYRVSRRPCATFVGRR